MKIFLTLALFISFHVSGYSQVIYSLNPDESSLTIQGTSSVHDWESIVENFNVEIRITESDSSNINIESLFFEAEVNSIKSGKRLMDRKTRGAFNEGDNPTITFTFSEILSISSESITVAGSLNMAGVTKDIEVTGQIEMTANELKISGNKELLMTDYGMKTPTAMAGALKTGDKVTINFNINLDQQ